MLKRIKKKLLPSRSNGNNFSLPKILSSSEAQNQSLSGTQSQSSSGSFPSSLTRQSSTPELNHSLSQVTILPSTYNQKNLSPIPDEKSLTYYPSGSEQKLSGSKQKDASTSMDSQVLLVQLELLQKQQKEFEERQKQFLEKQKELEMQYLEQKRKDQEEQRKREEVLENLIKQNNQLIQLAQSSLRASTPDIESEEKIQQKKILQQQTYDTELICFSKQGNIEQIRSALKKGANINAIDDQGETAIFHSIANGHTNVTSELLDYKPDFNLRNKEGKTILHKACETKNTDLVEYILAVYPLDDKKAEILLSILDTKPTFAIKKLIVNKILFQGTKQNNKELVAEALKNGADANAVNMDQDTPLHIACHYGYGEIIDLLLKEGAKMFSIKDRDDKSPFVITNEKIQRELNKNHLVILKNGSREVVSSEKIQTQLENPIVTLKDVSKNSPLVVSTEKIQNPLESPIDALNNVSKEAPLVPSQKIKRQLENHLAATFLQSYQRKKSFHFLQMQLATIAPMLLRDSQPEEVTRLSKLIEAKRFNLAKINIDAYIKKYEISLRSLPVSKDKAEDIAEYIAKQQTAIAEFIIANYDKSGDLSFSFPSFVDNGEALNEHQDNKATPFRLSNQG